MRRLLLALSLLGACSSSVAPERAPHAEKTVTLSERAQITRLRDRLDALITMVQVLLAIAVGLGAMMPDFRESSPSKIAAGFGGTLNLVLSAVYIILIVICTALPCHFYLIAGRGHFTETLMHPDQWRHWLLWGTVAALAIGCFATAVPLIMGLRAFRRLELA